MRSAPRLAATLCLFLLAAPGLASAQASRTVTKTAELRPDGEVVLDTYSGRIEVSTWDRSAVRVEARIEDSDRELVDRTQILVEGGPGRVTVADEVKENGGGGFLSQIFGGGDGDHPAVYYTLRVPRRASLTVDAYSSDLRAQNLGDDLAVDTYSGDTQVRGLRGRLTADTYSGNVSARNLDGSAVVGTYSGDTELAFARLTGDLTFDSYSGDVTLRLPRDAGFRLVADLGSGGDFTSDFSTDTFQIEDDVYRGTVGGGGPRIAFDTYSGDLRLVQR